MNNSIDKYENIGFLKNMTICLYDLMLLFSVLFFTSLPWIMMTSGEAITNNILSILFVTHNLNLLFMVLDYSWSNLRYEELESLRFKPK